MTMSSILKQKPMISRRRGWIILGIILGVCVGWYTVFAVGVYRFHWQGAMTQKIIRWTPLPAATIGWQPLSYQTYLHQRAAVQHYTAYLANTTGGVYQSQTANDISATTITKMIRLAASERAMRDLGITVTQADVQQAYSTQLLQNGDEQQVIATIRELYQWSPQEFQRYVIRPAIIRDKLQEKLSFDEQLSSAAKKQADTVYGYVQEGKESFAELAKKYSEDVYGAAGGDLGFVKQGEQAKEIDDAAFTMELNTVSSIIHTKYGYHIIKPLERKTEDGVEQVHLLQMTFLAPQVDTYLNQQLKSMSIRVFVPELTWETETQRATARTAGE